MKKFLLIGLPFQFVICLLIATCWFKWPLANEAEHILNFWGVLCLVVGTLAMLTQHKNYQKKADDPEYETSAWRAYTINFIIFCQIVAIIAMGWYWVGAGLAVARITFNVERDAVIKLRKERASNEQTS